MALTFDDLPEPIRAVLEPLGPEIHFAGLRRHLLTKDERAELLALVRRIGEGLDAPSYARHTELVARFTEATLVVRYNGADRSVRRLYAPPVHPSLPAEASPLLWAPDASGTLAEALLRASFHKRFARGRIGPAVPAVMTLLRDLGDAWTLPRRRILAMEAELALVAGAKRAAELGLDVGGIVTKALEGA
jgi:hypothetical protein